MEDGKLGFCKAKGEKKRMAREEKRVLSLKLKFSMHRRIYLPFWVQSLGFQIVDVTCHTRGLNLWAFR